VTPDHGAPKRQKPPIRGDALGAKNLFIIEPSEQRRVSHGDEHFYYQRLTEKKKGKKDDREEIVSRRTPPDTTTRQPNVP